MKEARGYSEASLDGLAKALSRFETYTRHRDFKAFRPEQAKGFKAKLAEQVNARTGERLSKATLHSTFRNLRAFFQWLAERPGYRSKLSYSDADYFSLSGNDARIAKARRETPVPTLEQIAFVLATMPTATDIDRRNRALIAFTILTGHAAARYGIPEAKHVNFRAGMIFPGRSGGRRQAEDLHDLVLPGGRRAASDRDRVCRTPSHDPALGNDDPLFPKTKIRLGRSGRLRRRVGTRMLEHRAADPGDISRGVPTRRVALLQPAQFP